jgi:hypothetical protein
MTKAVKTSLSSWLSLSNIQKKIKIYSKVSTQVCGFSDYGVA